MRAVIVAGSLLIAGAGAVALAADELPPFVQEYIERHSVGPRENPPASIWRLVYNGAEVFYIPPPCCDRFGQVYSRHGQYLCAPDGGLTGKGDGRCPDFRSESSEGVLIWRDTR